MDLGTGLLFEIVIRIDRNEKREAESKGCQDVDAPAQGYSWGEGLGPQFSKDGLSS